MKQHCPHCGGDLDGLLARLRERAHVAMSKKIKAGIGRAKAAGKRWGMTPKLAGDERAGLLKAVDENPDVPLSELARQHGVSRVTLWRYMREAGYGE